MTSCQVERFSAGFSLPLGATLKWKKLKRARVQPTKTIRLEALKRKIRGEKKAFTWGSWSALLSVLLLCWTVLIDVSLKLQASASQSRPGRTQGLHFCSVTDKRHMYMSIYTGNVIRASWSWPQLCPLQWKSWSHRGCEDTVPKFDQVKWKLSHQPAAAALLPWLICTISPRLEFKKTAGELWVGRWILLSSFCALRYNLKEKQKRKLWFIAEIKGTYVGNKAQCDISWKFLHDCMKSLKWYLAIEAEWSSWSSCQYWIIVSLQKVTVNGREDPL